MDIRMKLLRQKIFSLSIIIAFALVLSACDRCGDWIKSEGGQNPIACKGDGPKL
jgi:hypothetical protein